MSARAALASLVTTGMRGAALALAALLGAAAPGAAALAQEGGAGAGGVYLDLLEEGPLAALAEARAASQAGEHERAAALLQGFAEYAAGAGRDRLVPVRGGPDPAAPEAAAARPSPAAPPRVVESAYVSLPVLLRERLRALPPPGLRAYRALVDARAGALAAAAIAARDPALLEGVVRHDLFATRGAEAALLLGDILLERGDLTGALSTYTLAAAVPDAPPTASERLRAARERLRDEDARLARAPAAAAAVPPGAGAGDFPTRLALAIPFDAESEGAAAGYDCPPIPLEGGVAVARPGRVVVLRGVDPRTAAEAPTSAAALARRLPALSGDAPLVTRPGPFALGGDAARGLLAVALEHARGLLAADPDDPRPPGERGPGPAAPRPGQRPAAAWGAASAAARGGIFGDAYDLFVFDTSRGDKLLFTTAETGLLGAEHAEWLAQVDWTARPLLAPGLVLAAAAGRTGEPEVHAAAFEVAGRRPRLRWRAFLCARPYAGGEESGDGGDSPPLEPALARAGRLLLVDTACGLVAALDAHRGEIAWAVRRASPETGDPRRGVILDEEGGRPPARPTDAPLVIEAPVSSGRALAVFAPRTPAPASVLALDAETGETVWAIAAEEPAFPVAALGDGRVAVAEGAGISLVDGASGKRLGPALPLPPSPDAGDDDGGGRVGRGVALAGRLVVPTGGRVLVLRVEEGPRGAALVPERAVGEADGARVAVGVSGGRAVAADARGVVLFDVGGRSPAASWEDAVGVAEAYGAPVPPELVGALAARAEAARRSAPPGGADAPRSSAPRDPEGTLDGGTGPDLEVPFGVDEAAPSLVEDAATGTVRARLAPVVTRAADAAPPPPGPRVSLVLEPASGRLSVEVEPPEDGPLAAR